ncbi:LacI family DNA-binding transcriptional regulator [Clostridium estertheticum]|uniref:LacI family transcriptional regulator n=1 Tax=Clostridium estertheticum subsp. estertheticum TaxID=1552 RepID=A0A1J0GEM8_9CLOT|nr:LacI family DNA-binding transcriptional regulator [Clostridium estertheticum]APC39781.1 LacI family transcriptional regulator [Clostridium estertheticum subsp. estertheticum]MBU3185051.1 LacI family transcriptional regulator [Clostridium estertheticum]MBZ9614171.1 LacI family transcriptional regulator [Clostridium estertheticum subsp. laramiense]WAG74116.1 LacI family transcriptional regulator [Clostridium estertheticum]
MVGIKDIAIECNVSATTVSRALNNSKEISKKTRELILKTCEEKGYIPNSAARSLILNKTNMIGLLIPDITNQYYAYVSKGVSSYLEKIGYGLVLCNSDRNKDNENRYIDFLAQKRVDGIILIPVKPKASDYKKIIANVPLVMADNYVKDLEVSYVGNDNYVGARKIVSHMLRQGYRKIGVILGDESSTASNERLKGYKDILTENNIEISNDILLNSSANFEDGFKLAQILINKKVDAIFTINDSVAMGVMKYAHMNNILIPKDIGIAGYDDIEQASMLTVPLTTVHQKKFELGQIAAKILIEEINNHKTLKQTIILKPELVIRKSCNE